MLLLGMGGSSLGALAIHSLFGSAKGYPELTVLDTTVPDAITAVAHAVDCSKTLFVVASKSGTTIEPNALYRFFRALVEQDTGQMRLAITSLRYATEGPRLKNWRIGTAFGEPS